MEIRINGAVADIQLENEKTIGEILGALDSWLSGTGHRMSGLKIDEKPVNAASMEECFLRDINSIKILDIITSSLPELTAESLFNLLHDIDIFEETGFGEKGIFLEQWKISPEANLLAEQYPELYDWAILTFSGEGSNPHILRLMTEERIRELQNPAEEINRAEPLLDDICGRLENLSLDMQTGKEVKAAETVNAFSGIAEKIIRIFRILKMEGILTAEKTIQDIHLEVYLNEFNNVLRNLLNAYEKNDTVLAGDIAEYEIAPRLRNIYNAIKNIITGE